MIRSTRSLLYKSEMFTFKRHVTKPRRMLVAPAASASPFFKSFPFLLGQKFAQFKLDRFFHLILHILHFV